jgi:hypothetical protein
MHDDVLKIKQNKLQPCSLPTETKIGQYWIENTK